MQVGEERLDTAAERLERRTVMIGVAVGVVVGLALMLVNIWLGVAVAIVCPAVWAIYVRTMVTAAPARLVASTGARALDSDEYPRLQNLLDGLRSSTGVADLDVKVIDAAAMNAAVLSGRDRSEIIVTSGLVEGLGRLELEAVLANLLGRVRDGSARYCTVVLGLPGAARGQSRLRTVLGDQHAVRTDLAAVALTRYPPGLASALVAMDAAGTHVTAAPAETSALWLVPPHDSDADDVPISLRVAVLQEL